MAGYSALVGKRVEVHYRAGDVYLPAAGILTADTGKSIFLEEQVHRQGRMKTFRWEIPYPYIVTIEEVSAPSPPPPPSRPKRPPKPTELDQQARVTGLHRREEKA
jgi:hypothetical protein